MLIAAAMSGSGRKLTQRLEMTNIEVAMAGVAAEIMVVLMELMVSNC